MKIAVRTSAAVDRLTGVADPHRIACLEFAANAGWWGVFEVSDATWESRVKSAFGLLADSGFGGERSRGWGRAAAPEFNSASSLFPTVANEEGAWWLLSTYSPDAADSVDWSRGEYTAAQRGGWTDSNAGVAPKKQIRIIEEGSVIFAPSLRGRAVDVAPEGFPHPVYRAGFALAVPAPPEPRILEKVMWSTPTPEPQPESQPEAQPEPEAVMENEGAPPEPPATEVQPPAQPEAEAGMEHQGTRDFSRVPSDPEPPAETPTETSVEAPAATTPEQTPEEQQ